MRPVNPNAQRTSDADPTAVVSRLEEVGSDPPPVPVALNVAPRP